MFGILVRKAGTGLSWGEGVANLAYLVSYRPGWKPSSVIEYLLCMCKAEFHLKHQHRKQNSKQNTDIPGIGQPVTSGFRKQEV